jgi:hypothetical protein
LANLERLLYWQSSMVQDSLEALEPQRPGVVDLYFVGFAGSQSEDVFMREVRLVRELFDRRFDTAGRSLVYVNHPEAAFEEPIASPYALDWTLSELGAEMDAEEDILFLYLTSHGTDELFSISFPPLPLSQLLASDLKRMLDESGIKWRVIVISACYSGSFIDKLKDDNSLIVTASAADRTSFGCENGVDYTYWGKAYFDEALRESLSFIDAFEPAKTSVSARETAAEVSPSRPQMFVGAGIRDRLGLLEDRLRAASPGSE